MDVKIPQQPRFFVVKPDVKVNVDYLKPFMLQPVDIEGLRARRAYLQSEVDKAKVNAHHMRLALKTAKKQSATQLNYIRVLKRLVQRVGRLATYRGKLLHTACAVAFDTGMLTEERQKTWEAIVEQADMCCADVWSLKDERNLTLPELARTAIRMTKAITEHDTKQCLQKAYVVYGTSTTYEDHQVWAVRAFFDAKDADAFAAKAQIESDERLARFNTRWDKWAAKGEDDDKFPKRPKNHSLDPHWEGTETEYSVSELPIGPPAPPKTKKKPTKV